MRIVLKMFEGDWQMSSDIVNVPEGTGREFRMKLITPTRLPVSKWSNVFSDTSTQILIECVFLFSDRYTDSGAKIYLLNDIKGVTL